MQQSGKHGFQKYLASRCKRRALINLYNETYEEYDTDYPEDLADAVTASDEEVTAFVAANANTAQCKLVEIGRVLWDTHKIRLYNQFSCCSSCANVDIYTLALRWFA